MWFLYLTLLDVATLRIAKNASSCTLKGGGLAVCEKLNKLRDTVCDLLWLLGAAKVPNSLENDGQLS